MTPAERQAMRERLVDAEYDLGHSCEEFEYHWGDKRCYSYETDELCRYEPKCHDENREGKHYRIVAQAAILKDLSVALDEIDRLEAENEWLRAVAEAAKALIADPEWCSCSTINPNSRHAHDRPNLDYPATCAICGPTYCTGRTLNDALAALDGEVGE